MFCCSKGINKRVQGHFSTAEVLAVFVSGSLLIGSLIPTNTWDAPTYFCISLVVLVYLGIRYGFFGKRGEAAKGRIVPLLLLLVVFSALILGMVYPYLSTNTQENKVGLYRDERTPLSSFVMHWGVFLFYITVWYGMEVYQWMKYTSLRECLDLLKSKRSWILTGMAAALLLLICFAADGVKIIWSCSH